ATGVSRRVSIRTGETPVPLYFALFAVASSALHFVYMVRLALLFLILFALIFGVASVFAAPSAEDRAFAVAMDKFEHLSPDLAEKDFADFVRKYPTSIRVPEAILYQAQAMLFSGQP